MRRLILALVCVAAAFSPAGAQQSRVVTDISPSEVAELARAKGWEPKIETGNEGRPRVSFKVDGHNSVIFMQRCANGRCKDMYLYAGFKMDRAPSLTLINDWNRDRRFSRAYLDQEGDPIMESDYDFDGGGTQSGAREWLSTWQQSLTKFVKHIGFE